MQGRFRSHRLSGCLLVAGALAVAMLGAPAAQAKCSQFLTGGGLTMQRPLYNHGIWEGVGYNGGNPLESEDELCQFTPAGYGNEMWGAYSLSSTPREEESPAGSGWSFIATDEAPGGRDESEYSFMDPLADMDRAAGGPGQALVIPVAQESIAVIVDPPEGCKIDAITNKDLLKIWGDEIGKWSEVTEGAGEGAGVTNETPGACNATIKRAVPREISGQTMVFKRYLHEIAGSANYCAAKVRWWELSLRMSQFQLSWPSEEEGQYAGCGGNSPLVRPSVESIRRYVEFVKETPDSIGFANLADARQIYNGEAGNHYHWLRLQNHIELEYYPWPGRTNVLGEEPTEASGEANCTGTHYTNLPSLEEPEADDEWWLVQGAHPHSNYGYPICTLTYIVALRNYGTAEYAHPGAVGEQTREFLEWVVADGSGKGQRVAQEHDFLEVEEAVGAFSRGEVELIER